MTSQEQKPGTAAKKYGFTGKKLNIRDNYNIPEKHRGLSQIKALRDIPEHGIKKGMTGGYIEDETNLSQTGAAWVGKHAAVCNDAKVEGNALVSGSVFVYNHAKIIGNAKVTGNRYMEISGLVTITGDAIVNMCGEIVGGDERIPIKEWDFQKHEKTILIAGNAEITTNKIDSYRVWIKGQNIFIYENAKIGSEENTNIGSNVTIGGNAVVRGASLSGVTVKDNVEIYTSHINGKDVKIYENAKIYGAYTEFRITGNAKIHGNTVIGVPGEREGNKITISNDVEICGDAKVIGSDITLEHGVFTGDTEDHSIPGNRQRIAGAINAFPVNGEYLFYKQVRRVGRGVFLSYGCENHLFRDGKPTVSYDAPNATPYSRERGIGKTYITLKHGLKWNEAINGDSTIIALKVREKDIFRIYGKDILCNKVTTVGEVTSPKDMRGMG